MRFAHPYRKTADKCTFCVHRLDRGLQPACVDACIGKSRIFGNILDPKSEVARIIKTQPVHVLKPEQNTKPHVYYLNLDYFMVDANKADFKYMKHYRRDIAKEIGLSKAQLSATHEVLNGKCGADRVYDYKLKSNINKAGTV
jgi:tetrathionate reductase subunit B